MPGRRCSVLESLGCPWKTLEMRATKSGIELSSPSASPLYCCCSFSSSASLSCSSWRRWSCRTRRRSRTSPGPRSMAGWRCRWQFQSWQTHDLHPGNGHQAGRQRPAASKPKQLPEKKLLVHLSERRRLLFISILLFHVGSEALIWSLNGPGKLVRQKKVSISLKERCRGGKLVSCLRFCGWN